MNGFPPSSEYNHHLMYYVYVCVKERESLASTLGKFQLHSTIWSTLVTMLHIKSSDLLFILLLKVCTLLQHLMISPTPQPLATTFLFCEFDLPFVYLYSCCSCLVAKSCPTLMQPHGLQPARLFCLPLSPGVCSDSFQLSQWCYLTVSSSAVLFSFCLQSFSASESFPLTQLFAAGYQSIGASASVLPVTIQDWFPLGLTGLISLMSKGLSRVFSTEVQNHQCFNTQPSLWSNSHPSLWSNSHIHTWLLEKL